MDFQHADYEIIRAAAAALAETADRSAFLERAADLQRLLSALLAADEPASSPAPGGLSLAAQAEALLFVAPEPLDVAALGKLLERDEAGTQALLAELDRSLRGRGIRLQRAEDRLQLVSAPEAAPQIERLINAPASTKLSPAALETLAIIAYRQPVTRAQIESVRGVDSSGVVRVLLARGLIAEAGRAETVGRPILYTTTSEFLSQFGLASLEELPELELPELEHLPAEGEVRSEQAADTE